VLQPDTHAITTLLAALDHVWCYTVEPGGLDLAVFETPRGADWAAVAVTDSRSEVDHWLLFTTRRLPPRPGRPGRSLSARQAQVELTRWLNLRHACEVRSSAGWQAMAAVATVPPAAQPA
jgi:hypothetical protein